MFMNSLFQDKFRANGCNVSWLNGIEDCFLYGFGGRKRLGADHGLQHKFGSVDIHGERIKLM